MEQPKEILIKDLEKSVKLRLPTAVHRYLAMRTDFAIREWELSPSKFEDKWRLALLLMEGEAQPHHIISVLNGGLLYPMGGRDPVFCPECTHEMSQLADDILICGHCAHVIENI